MRFRRIAAISAWALAAFVGWFVGLVPAMLLLQSFVVRHGWNPLTRWLPEPAEFYGLFGVGPMVFTVSAVLLGLLGKLPGTRTHQGKARRGFPVQSVQSRD